MVQYFRLCVLLQSDKRKDLRSARSRKSEIASQIDNNKVIKKKTNEYQIYFQDSGYRLRMCGYNGLMQQG